MEKSLRRQHRHWLVALASLAILAFSLTPAIAQPRFTNVAQMVSATIPAGMSGQQVIVSGRLTANDGGGGVFVYDSASVTATNLGTIFKPNGSNGRWLRQYPSGILFASWFGAKGDGVADDTASIQNLATFVSETARKGNITVDINPGRYLITSTVDWGTTHGLTIQGNFGDSDDFASTPDTVFQWSGAVSGPVFWFKDNTLDLTVRNVGFQGGEEGIRVRRTGMALSVNRQLRFERCRFGGQTIFGIGVGFEWSDTTSDEDINGVWIVKCHFGENTPTGIQVNVLDNFYRLIVDGCTFRGIRSIRSRGIRNVRLLDLDIASQGASDYFLDFLKGAGYFDLNGLYLEQNNSVTNNIRVIRTQNWSGSTGQDTAILQNIVLNSVATNGASAAISINQPLITHHVIASWRDPGGGGGQVARNINTDNGVVALLPASVIRNQDVYSDASTLNVKVGSGKVQTSDGTVALPAYTFFNDPSIGWWHPSTNAIALSVAGAQVYAYTNSVHSFTGNFFDGGIIAGRDVGFTRTSEDLDVEWRTVTSGGLQFMIRGFNNGTNPAASSGGAPSFGLHNQDATTNAFTAIRFFDASENAVAGIFGINKSDAANQGSLKFYTRPNAGSLTERFEMTDEGGLRGLELGSDHSAPSANEGVLYFRDSGGKTQLVVRFNSGAVQVIATEP